MAEEKIRGPGVALWWPAGHAFHVPANLQHDLIAELKAIAADLGRVPSRDEFLARSKLGQHAYRREFGGYTPLLHAAGFRPAASSKRSIFEADIREMIKPVADQAPRTARHGVSEKILVLGDTHFPFASPDALSGVYTWAAENPDVTHIVQLGDLFDCYSFAAFPKSVLQFTPKQEIDLAREMAGEMWATLRRLCPKAECHQILGNHSLRPMKRILEQAPELEVFMDYLKFWQFEGVTLHPDARAPLVIGDVHFMHGYLLKLGDHAKRHGVNVVCGHTHRGGMVAMQLADGRGVYELNAGYLGDPRTKALSYTATKLVEWTHGFGVIDRYGPRFVLL